MTCCAMPPGGIEPSSPAYHAGARPLSYGGIQWRSRHGPGGSRTLIPGMQSRDLDRWTTEPSRCLEYNSQWTRRESNPHHRPAEAASYRWTTWPFIGLHGHGRTRTSVAAERAVSSLLDDVPVALSRAWTRRESNPHCRRAMPVSSHWTTCPSWILSMASPGPSSLDALLEEVLTARSTRGNDSSRAKRARRGRAPRLHCS